MERELRGFADGPAKNQDRGNCQIIGIARDARQMGNDVIEHDRAGRHPNHQDPDHESEIADACGEKCFLRGLGGGIALKPMTDEDVGSETDQLPKDEHHHEIVREDNAEHREHEERERGEVARFAFVVAHVA